MHIYTMGTRAYAEEVCAAIDPDDSLFGRRILSRDESGSASCRSLGILHYNTNQMDPYRFDAEKFTKVVSL
jgi:TFIIF-interacting CTD phosphatase-like protein